MTLALAAEDIPDLSAQLKPQFHITPDVGIPSDNAAVPCRGLHLPDLALFLDRCEISVRALCGS